MYDSISNVFSFSNLLSFLKVSNTVIATINHLYLDNLHSPMLTLIILLPILTFHK